MSDRFLRVENPQRSGWHEILDKALCFCPQTSHHGGSTAISHAVAGLGIARDVGLERAGGGEGLCRGRQAYRGTIRRERPASASPARNGGGGGDVVEAQGHDAVSRQE